MSHKSTVPATNGIHLNSQHECQFCSGYHRYREYGICGEPILDPSDPENHFKCTRPAGHSGVHVACVPNLSKAGTMAHDLSGAHTSVFTGRGAA